MTVHAPSLQSLWESAGAVLAAGGLAESRREAIRLWSALAGVSTADALVGKGDAVVPMLAERFLAAVSRRAAGEPFAHVVGQAGFRHLDLLSDRRALIPRPETEGLVELALGCTRHGIAADIGTGTGAIALALATEGAYDRVIGTDLSADALALARQNGIRTGVTIDWREGDLLAPLAGEHLDLLVSNPPYLTDAELAALDPAVAAWEPHLALASGPDGLTATRRLLEDGRAVLVTGGWLVLELDCHRAPLVAALAESLGWRGVRIHDDLFGRARFAVARWEG